LERQSIFLDIIILILPIRPLWHIQVSLRKRLILISIVTLGGVVVVVSICRLIVLNQFRKEIDATYALGKLIIVSSIELEMAIIAANAPSLKILWSKYISKSTYMTKEERGHTLSKISDVSKMSTALSEQGVLSQSSRYASSNYLPQQQPHSGGVLESVQWQDDSEGSQDIGIRVTSSVGVEVHTAHNPPGMVDSYYHFNTV